MRNKSLFRGIAIVSALLLFSMAWVGLGSASTERLWIEKPAMTETPEVAVGGTLFRELASSLSPAVVSVQSLQKAPAVMHGFPPFGGPGMKNQHDQKNLIPRGAGSGFIIHKDGYILTNAHVVAGSEEVEVSLSDNGLYKGRLIGMDEISDTALIKIEPKRELPVLPLGNSDNMKPGDWVMAIGSPFGLDLTVTVGIVSAKGRALGASPYDDFIQTDTPINPGNSGGPLINTRGEVVGINTAILAQGQGLGFSLPINTVKKIVPQLKDTGHVTRSWMGVAVQDITLAAKESMNLHVDRGSLVMDVIAESPAYKAGIKRNDVIVEFDGATIKNSLDLPKRVAYSPRGEPITLKLVRGEKTITLDIILEKTPDRRHMG